MYMVNATAPLVNLNNSDLTYNMTTKLSYYSADIYLPKGSFLLCGLQAYIYVPQNATGRLCTWKTQSLPTNKTLHKKKQKEPTSGSTIGL